MNITMCGDLAYEKVHDSVRKFQSGITYVVLFFCEWFCGSRLQPASFCQFLGLMVSSIIIFISFHANYLMWFIRLYYQVLG